jgi:hypothetical protein
VFGEELRRILLAVRDRVGECPSQRRWCWRGRSGGPRRRRQLKVSPASEGHWRVLRPRESVQEPYEKQCDPDDARHSSPHVPSCTILRRQPHLHKRN